MLCRDMGWGYNTTFPVITQERCCSWEGSLICSLCNNEHNKGKVMGNSSRQVYCQSAEGPFYWPGVPPREECCLPGACVRVVTETEVSYRPLIIMCCCCFTWHQGYCQEHPNKYTGSQSPESSSKGLWNTGRFSINPPNQREMCLRGPVESGRSTNGYRIGHTARALAHFEKPVLCGADGVREDKVLSLVKDLPSWSRGLKAEVTKEAQPQFIPNPTA